MLAASTSALHARPLTPAEQPVCKSLKVCLDIVRRHDGSEFDYAALEAEFRRFGPSGKAALFGLLESDAGQADIARLISKLESLTADDRRRIQEKWSKEKAEAYLPLLLDTHPISRDLILQSLDHPKAQVRETARLALIRFPQTAKTAPLPSPIRSALISALRKDPIAETAPYLARVSPIGIERQLAEFLRSGKGWLVTSAYSALYRKNPAEAFNALLTEMERMVTPAQSKAVGHMLAIRHRSRGDGFYLKFASDMSGDPKLSVAARASGLHAVLQIAEGPFPPLTPERTEALSFLVKAQPFITQDQYLPYLKKVRADAAMSLIWNVAATEKWINRDRVAGFFDDHKLAPKIIANLIQSKDSRTFRAGLERAEPLHNSLIRRQTHNPVTEIARAARKKLGIPNLNNLGKKCKFKKFDLEDIRNQMPFFDSGWIVANNGARMSLTRAHLTTAHPSRSGWLAGYDLTKSNRRPANSGGSLLHYDNKSGGFKVVGDFSKPIAVLPSRPLKIGQTTDQLWVIDQWAGEAADVSAYLLDLGDGTAKITHIGALPKTAHKFSISPGGDLLISFADKDQGEIWLTQSGQISAACGRAQPATASRAPK